MHKFFRGDDAGRRYVQRRNTFDMRLSLTNFASADQSKPFDPVLFSALLQRDEFGFLVCIDGND